MKQINQSDSFVSFSFNVDNILNLFQESSIVGGNIVRSAWMIAAVVSWLPLMKVVFGGSVIVMMVEDSFSEFPISVSDSSWESSQIGELDSVLVENVEDVLSVGVTFLQDLLFLDSGVVASVSDWAGVVVAVEGSVMHGDIFLLVKIY